MSVIAIYLAFAQSAGYGVMAAVMACVLVIRWALQSPRRGWVLGIRAVGTICATTAFWFLAVDWSWFIWGCEDCRTSIDHAHYRVLGINVTTDSVRRESVFGTALKDMGVPCTHLNSSDWHKHRRWGGLWCASPCWNGICGLIGDDDRYTDSIAKRLRNRARQDSKFAQEAYRQVVEDHNYAYFWDAIMADQMVLDSLNQWKSTEAREWLKIAVVAPPAYSGCRSKAEISLLVEKCYELGAPEVIVFEISYIPALKVGENFFREDVASIVYRMGSRTKIAAETVVVQDAKYLGVRLPDDSTRRARVFNWNADYEQSYGYCSARDYGQEFLLFYLD